MILTFYNKMFRFGQNPRVVLSVGFGNLSAAYLNEHFLQLVQGLLRPLAILRRHGGQFRRGFAGLDVHLCEVDDAVGQRAEGAAGVEG